MDNIKEWTSLPKPELLTRASCKKTPEEYLCWVVPHVPSPIQSVKGLNWLDPMAINTFFTAMKNHCCLALWSHGSAVGGGGILEKKVSNCFKPLWRSSVILSQTLSLWRNNPNLHTREFSFTTQLALQKENTKKKSEWHEGRPIKRRKNDLFACLFD